MMRAYYIGGGDSGVTVDGRPICTGDYVDRPRSVVENLLERKDWAEKPLSVKESAIDAPDPPTASGLADLQGASIADIDSKE